jgi:hypothetical protein
MNFKKVLPYMLAVCGAGVLLFFGYIFTLLLSLGKFEDIVTELSELVNREPMFMAVIAGVLIIIVISIFTAIVMIYAAVNLLRFPDKKWTFRELVGLE